MAIDTSTYTYWVRSKKDGGFEGLCDQMPSLRCEGQTREEAMQAIRAEAKKVMDGILSCGVCRREK